MSLFRIAAGKEKSEYDSIEKFDEQKFEVEHIHYDSEYQDLIGHFFADIVIIVLKTPIEFKSYIGPICIPFGRPWFSERNSYPKEKGEESIPSEFILH